MITRKEKPASKARPKNKVSDVMMPSQKSKVEPAKKRMGSTSSSSKNRGDYVLGKELLSVDSRSGRGGRAFAYILVVIFLIAVILVLGAYVFDQAEVSVTPHTLVLPVNTVLAAASEPSEGKLHYETMTIERTLAEPVEVTDYTTVEEYASGTIVIFNEETTVQKLREETRFESPEGYVYKLAKGPGITVPAAVGDTPGSVEAMVYADVAGDTYNIDLVDFVIPGWREIEDDRFATQYARSKTPMTGGGSGTRAQIAPETQAEMEQAMQSVLTEQLMTQISVEVPENFVYFAGSEAITFETLEIREEVGSEGSQAHLAGTANVILFPEAVLAGHLLEQSKPNEYQGERFHILNRDDMVITFSPQSEDALGETSTETGGDTLRFRLAGDMNLVSYVNTEKLSEQLADSALSDIEEILALVTEIKEAKVAVRPFWKMHMPRNTEDITIHIETEV